MSPGALVLSVTAALFVVSYTAAACSVYRYAVRTFEQSRGIRLRDRRGFVFHATLFLTLFALWPVLISVGVLKVWLLRGRLRSECTTKYAYGESGRIELPTFCECRVCRDARTRAELHVCDGGLRKSNP